MIRDLIASFVGHAVVLVSLFVTSIFGEKPIIQHLDVYRVKTITPQSISELLKKVENIDKPKPNIPQIQTKTKTLPQEHRKESQTVKRSLPKDSNTSVSNSESKTSGLKGLQVDSEIDVKYLLELRDRIEQNWRPPNVSESLVVTVYFKIGRNGKVSRVFVEKPTGNITYDASSFKAVSASDPFSPLPDDFENDNLGVHFDFIYEID